MLENISYSPTLFTRVAETKALLQLPAATKDRVFPILLARPWPNARSLDRTWEKIDEAFGDRRFALDLDRTKFGSESRREAAREFDRLFEDRDGYSNYFALIRDLPWAIPVLRIWGGSARNLDQQLTQIEALDRGLVVRLEHGRVENPLGLCREVIETGCDCLYVVDCGWSRDLLGQEVWASGLIGQITEEQPEAEIVVTGSSFPDSFVGMGARGLIPVMERSLYNNLTRRHNAAHIIYGDWGSTRPPSDPVPMRNIPRIDLPETGNWIAFRRDADSFPDENYEQIAQRVVSDEAWPNNLNIWGTYTITNTANGLPGSIRSPATAAAARINIHLHRQAYFGANFEASDTDEPFED